MTETDEKSILRKKWLALFEDTFAAGERSGEARLQARFDEVRVGLEEMVARVSKTRVGPQASLPSSGIFNGVSAPRKSEEKNRLPYGSAKSAVRRALATHPEGITKPEIASFCAGWLDIKIMKMDSVTEALKSLARDREADNPERGTWVPGPKMDWEEAGVSAPASLEFQQNMEDR